MDDDTKLAMTESIARSKESNLHQEIRKRDEIITKLTERLKESVIYRDNQIQEQFIQITDLTVHLEHLQLQFQQAEEKLKLQNQRQNESVETVEHVKENLIELQNNLQNVQVDFKVKTPENATIDLHSLQQCDAVSSTDSNLQESSELQQTCSQLRQEIENMEEKHLKDLQSQKVELSFKFEKEAAENKKTQELKLKQFKEIVTIEKQKEFIKALQKMKKAMKRESSSQEDSTGEPPTKSSNSKQQKHGDIVTKLSQENQELAEIRDILLQQADISHENQVLLQNELKTYTDNVTSELSEDELFMDEIEKLSVSNTDINLEWQLFSPCEGINSDHTPTKTNLGFFETDHESSFNPSIMEMAPNDNSIIKCQNKDCVFLREKYYMTNTYTKVNSLTSLSNSPPQSDSGIGDLCLKDIPKHCDPNEFDSVEAASGTIPFNSNSHDLQSEIQQLKLLNKVLEDKIENQFQVFSDEKNNFSKICEALKVQVENLLLAKAHLELELESKNVAILTLTEEFHNSLGRFEVDRESLEEDDREERSVHFDSNNEVCGSFVREDDGSALDMLLNEPQIHSEGEIEFWDTNFSNRCKLTTDKVQSFPKQDPLVYEIDPDLQLHGHSPTDNLQYLSELEEKEKIIEDFILQVNSLERQLKSSKQFISEQSGERESERDDSCKEINRLKQLIEEKDSQLKCNKNLYHEIGDMKDRIDSLQEEIAALGQDNTSLKQKLSESYQKNGELEQQLQLLESELEERNKDNENNIETGDFCLQNSSMESVAPALNSIDEQSEHDIRFRRLKSDSEMSLTSSIETELRMKQLQDEVCALNYKLRQEKLVGADVLKSLVSEQKRCNSLLKKETKENSDTSEEFIDQWLHVSRLQNSLVEEQNYCSRLLDALEEQQSKYRQVKIRLKEEEDHRCNIEEELSRARLHNLIIPPDNNNQISKLQRLYARYLRAESYRKALVYQKKYLLILIGGYQDTEQTTLSLIAKISCPEPYSISRYPYYTPVLHVFRRTVTVLIAIFRMKLMVKKWRRAVKVGAPIVCGMSNVNYGYLSSQSSFYSECNQPR